MVYVDDLNIIGTNEIDETVNCMKKEFEMNDLGRTKFGLNLQIEHLKDGIHQSSYPEKILKRFYVDKAHPLGSPMIVRSLKINEAPLHPREEGEKVLCHEVPYLSAIGALMYLATNT